MGAPPGRRAVGHRVHGVTDPTRRWPTAQAPTGSAVPGVSGMPPTELSVAGITVVQSMGDDPALQGGGAPPGRPRTGGLSDAIAGLGDQRRESPSAVTTSPSEAPAELNVGWQVVTASGPVLGIRMETFEFGGASGQTSHRVFYGDGSDTWTGVDLIDRVGGARQRSPACWRRSARRVTHARPRSGPGSPAVDAQDVLTDVTFSAAGDVVVLLDQGTAPPTRRATSPSPSRQRTAECCPSGAVGSRRRSDPACRMPCPSPHRRPPPPGGHRQVRAARRQPRHPPHRRRRRRVPCLRLPSTAPC
jgi:hypothetical protein